MGPGGNGLAREIDLFLSITKDGIIAVDREGTITLFNPAAERILGMVAKEVLGRTIGDVLPVTRLPAVMETRLEEIDHQLTWKGTTIVTSRYPIIDGDGVVGAVAVFRDISAVQRLAEEVTNLREVRIMYEAIFRSTQDAISVVDRDGIGVQVNPAYTRVTGLAPDEVTGKPCTVDISSGESVHMEVLRTGRSVRGHRISVGPAAKEVVVDAAPILVDGEVRGSVAVLKDVTELLRLHDRLADAHRTIRNLEARYSFDDVVGENGHFVEVREKAKIVATTPATILLRGESGTGKELFAHAIHNASARRNGKFIRVNCAVLSETLLESELFGYVEGAFTGARKGGRRGLFEEAHGGTIFLDEVGVMNLGTQAKLLRVLQEREVRRVGGTETIPIDVRVVTATNLDLARERAEGRFREDLYYRLHVVPISIPPLRDRRDDIETIANALLRKINLEYGRAVESIGAGALELLRRHDWPGNVRELENVLRRAVIAMRIAETTIRADHVPELGPATEETFSNPIPTAGPVPQLHSLADVRRFAERRHIELALQATGGNRTRAAEALGISIRSLHYKIRALDLI